jgi:hypothetical protein
LRNPWVAHAQGELLFHWDHDDRYHAERLQFMAAGLLSQNVTAVFLQRWLIWWPARRRLVVSGSRTWEGSMLVRRDVLPANPAQGVAEDNTTIARLCSMYATLLIDRPDMYCYIVHGDNNYEDGHFETMMDWASQVIPGDRYEDERVSDLTASFPLVDYAASLTR